MPALLRMKQHENGMPKKVMRRGHTISLMKTRWDETLQQGVAELLGRVM